MVAEQRMMEATGEGSPFVVCIIIITIVIIIIAIVIIIIANFIIIITIVVITIITIVIIIIAILIIMNRQSAIPVHRCDILAALAGCHWHWNQIHHDHDCNQNHHNCDCSQSHHDHDFSPYLNKNINNPQVRHLGSLGWLSLALEPCLGGDLWGAIQAAGGR